MEDLLILVNEKDEDIGNEHKMEVHKQGLLHRAFSVFLFNEQGELMLQKRAMSKYHSAGLWTNTCCGHPKPSENTLNAAKRRLLEEMGIECDLQKIFSFTYRVTFDNGLVENEIDHVYCGVFNSDPILNMEEVEEWKFSSLKKIEISMEMNPEYYTEWFKICFAEIKRYKKITYSQQ